LGEFLRALNAHPSLLETVKCDVWSTDHFGMEEEAYGAKWKLSSYVDVIFDVEKAAARFSFSAHEDWARSLAQLLREAPEVPAACEAIVRRCYYRPEAAKTLPERIGEPEPGFYLTLYTSGYGQNESEARQRWGTALQLVADACLQLSARLQR
jgi:hypothetical protein